MRWLSLFLACQYLNSGRIFVSARIRGGSRFKGFLCFVLIDVRCLSVPPGVCVPQVKYIIYILYYWWEWFMKYRWDALRWNNILTKFHEYRLGNWDNIRIGTWVVWVAVLVLLIWRIYDVRVSSWDGMRWHNIDTKFHEDWFRHSKIFEEGYT
jgi:hypothetical protein